MFALVTSIISIALVAILGFASIYYVGDATTQSRAAAQAATIINGGEQIMAGISAYYVDHSRNPASLDEVVKKGFLNSIPEFKLSHSVELISSAYAMPINGSGNWLYDSSRPHLAYIGAVPMTVCAEVNKQSSDRRMVLNIIDPTPYAQCVVKGGQEPVVFFRHPGERNFEGWDEHPRIPEIGLPGVIEEVAQDIAEDGEDQSGRCVYGCSADEASGGAQDTEDPETPPSDPPPSTADATCMPGGRYMRETGFSPEQEYEFAEVIEQNCSPFVFPKEWNVSNFDRAVLSGAGFEDIVAHDLQKVGSVYGVMPGASYLRMSSEGTTLDVQSQVATLTVYDKSNNTIGSMPVKIERMPDASITRIDRPYNMVSIGVSDARYRVDFTSEADSLAIIASSDMTLINSREFLWNVSEPYSYSEKIDFQSSGGFSWSKEIGNYVINGALSTVFDFSPVTCTSKGINWTNTRITVSMDPDNPNGANLMNQQMNKSASSFKMSFLDLPEAGPHVFNVYGPYTLVATSAPTSPAVSGVDYDPEYVPSNPGLVRYTYTIKLEASSVTESGSFSIFNRFGKYSGVGMSLRSTDAPIAERMWGGTVTCN